jgi:Resolvase, N terminal domain
MRRGEQEGIDMMGKPKRAALYVRVSTDHQSVENQVRELKEVAERRGWQVVETYRDAGISGAKGRDKRPGLDAMLKDANRRKFDVVMARAIDRLGRSLIDLLGTIEHLQEVGVDIYLDQQQIDTTTPTGKLLFQITGAFAEFERSMIRQRIRAGLASSRPSWPATASSSARRARCAESWAGQAPNPTRSSAPAFGQGRRHRQGGERDRPRRRQRPSPEA